MNTLDRYNNQILAKQYDLSEQGSNNNDVEFYSKLLKNTNKALELGCGTGRITIPLKKIGINIDGIDFANEMIKIAKKKANQEGLDISFKVDNAINFKSKDKYDSIIFTYNSLVMLSKKDIITFINNLKKNLEEDGLFAFDISIPNKKYNKLPLLTKKDWSLPILIKELGVSLRRKITTKISKDRKKTEITYVWEITYRNKKQKIIKTKVVFLKEELNWYINLFKKYNFVLKEKNILKNKDKAMDHVFIVFKNKNI
jgi:2-polyprenyl-3-methyl-5-hydroxy-6-metoxy-1,4-benzoquinol methylase